MKRIHNGFLKIDSNGEEDDILYLNSEPLAEELEYLHCKIATIKYYISDKEITLEQAEELFIKSLFGQIEADYCMRYSDITGYLWTDEELMVGGHDLLNELKTYNGKYLILIADTDNPQEKERVYQSRLRDFKMHLKHLNTIAEHLGEDRDTLIKKIESPNSNE